MQSPIKAFNDTPITKFLCYSVILLPITVSLLQIKHIFYYSYVPFISEWKQYWRILTFQTVVINESDMLLCLLLLYHFKVLERHYGSYKYLSYWVLNAVYICVISSGLMTVCSILPFRLFNSMQSGPIGAIMSFWYQYLNVIPSTYRFEISVSSSLDRKLILTDKTFVFLFGMVLLFNNGLSSIYHGLIGMFIGQLTVNDLLVGSRWRLPFYEAIGRIFNKPVILREELSEEDAQEQNIRAETPVRPLGSQLLDTFRT